MKIESDERNFRFPQEECHPEMSISWHAIGQTVGTPRRGARAAQAGRRGHEGEGG